MNNRIEKNFLIGIAILLIIAAIVAWCIDYEEFWKFSVGEFLTLLITVGIGYYLVEKKSDNRLLNEMIIKIVERIEEKLDSTDYITIDPKNNWRDILANNRWMKNKIYILERISKKNTKIEKPVQIIKSKFDEYEMFVTANRTFTKKNYEEPLTFSSQKQKIDDIIFQLEQVVLSVYDIP